MGGAKRTLEIANLYRGGIEARGGDGTLSELAIEFRFLCHDLHPERDCLSFHCRDKVLKRVPLRFRQAKRLGELTT